ncbi:lasso peptide biosynthesis PqqD family chaperone [Bacillus sp. 1P02SD]|uniref:lasso peptide biosynthesis PqqD family chaperone n=1 Tax=Bacillus sp. 1P02SD TaxID=3132264 RepID=UPI0039A19405
MMIKNQTISLNNTVSQSEGNIVSNMGEEKVMLSVQNGKYYNLGEIGGEIWDLIESPKSVNEVISSLVNDYDVTQTECEEQVQSFLEHLYNEKLIELK